MSEFTVVHRDSEMCASSGHFTNSFGHGRGNGSELRV